MSLKRYDAAQVTLILANVPVSSGFNEGEFLTIEQSAPDYEVVVGTDGQVGRSRTNNRHATIKVKLMQTSDGNTLFSAVSNLGLLAKNGSDVGALMIRDRISGLCTYTAAECWISKPPDVTYDNKITVREWTLECAQLIRVDAGS
jgi:structural protein KPP10_ORF10